MHRAFATATAGALALLATPCGWADAHPARTLPGPDTDAALPAETAAPIAIRIDDRPFRILNRVRPDETFGAGVDGVPFPAVPEIYRPGRVRQMLAAGLAPVSYRLYTELSVQDRH